MKKQLYILSFLAFFSINAMEDNKTLHVKPTSIFARSDVGNFDLYHDNSGFTVIQDGKMFPIERHSLDLVLRKIDHKQLKKFQKLGYIHVKKNDENQFSLVSNLRVRGGGAGGATAGFWLGRLAAQTVGYGIVALVALPAMVGGPVAYSVAVAGLAGTCAPLIESASHIVAIGTAITAGVATGPA